MGAIFVARSVRCPDACSARPSVVWARAFPALPCTCSQLGLLRQIRSCKRVRAPSRRRTAVGASPRRPACGAGSPVCPGACRRQGVRQAQNSPQGLFCVRAHCIGLVARRRTHFAHCVRYVQTNVDESVVDARCARGHEPCAPRRLRCAPPTARLRLVEEGCVTRSSVSHLSSELCRYWWYVRCGFQAK